MRDCDVEKLDVISEYETDDGVVVWQSARVDGRLMVIRYLDSQQSALPDTEVTYLSHIAKLS